MSKHTPGPWRLSTLNFAMNDGAIPVIAAETRICLVDPQVKIKRGEGYKTQCAERDANAIVVKP